MKCLSKRKLKVLGYEFVEGRGREALQRISLNERRRYMLESDVRLIVKTNLGNLHVFTSAGFIFDGRSGPKIVDWYAPNLGTLEERICWLVHDCNGYGQDLSFKDTNVLLFAMLRDLAGYRRSKASVIHLAVSLSRSWYGTPKPGEWCCANVKKVRTLWMPKDDAA